MSVSHIVAQRALSLYNDHLMYEWSDELQEDQTLAANWMTQESRSLGDILSISDENLVLRFSAGLFANAHTFLCICQQWESMASHTIASRELEGKGRVWALFLHVLLCEPDLNIEIITIFQEYEEIIYPFGVEPSRLIQMLYKKGWLDNTPLDTADKKNRVTSPAFLRFDVKFLSTISGRLALCMIQHRNGFDSTTFREESNTAYFQSLLRENLEPIYRTVFEHFRPCIVSCLLTAVTWAACSRGENYRRDMASCLAKLIVHVEKIREWATRALENEEYQSVQDRRILEKCVQRLDHLGQAVLFFEEKCKSLGYSLLSLCAMYTARWKSLEKL